MQNNLEPLLEKAKELEKKYEWLQAAESYKKSSDLVLAEKYILKAAELQERLGFCFYRGAFQVQTNDEFRKLLKQAIQVYEKTSKLLGGIDGANNQVRIDHANALVAYTRSWLETKRSKKRKLVNKWWALEKKVLKAYETAGDLRSVGRTCNNLIEWGSYDRFHIPNTSAQKEKIFKEANYLAEKSIEALSKLDDKYELARAYCSYSGYYGSIGNFFKEENETLKFAQKCRDYANKALELSQKIGDAGLIGRSYLSAATVAQLLHNPALVLKLAQNILKHGKIAKDNYLIGWGKTLTSQSKVDLWTNLEDPDKARAELNEAIEMANEATCNFEIIDHATGLAWSYHYHSLALQFMVPSEPNLKKRKELFETAGKVIQEGLERLGEWGLAKPLHFTLCLYTLFLSYTKTDLAEKRDLLQKALYYARRGISVHREQGRGEYTADPFYILQCDVQTRLADIETDRKKKIRLLNSAVSSEEKYVKQIEKRKRIYAQTDFGKSFHFGYRYFKIGAILRRIYFLTKEQKTLERAIEAYKKAITVYESADLPTRLAEPCWIVAQLNDLQGKWQASSQNYELAAEAYDHAAEKIPSLKHFFENYASYMRAWNQIEQARHSHSIEDYTKAKEHYEKSAEFHELTDKWNYLAPNYLAWASMEEAECLSRREDTQQAKNTFQKAYEQFCNAEESIKQKLDEIRKDPIHYYRLDEKEMIQKLLKSSDLRCKYCQARILVEDAKLMDRKGRHIDSSNKYGEAAKSISAIIEKMDVEAERKELEYLAILCHAWEKMAVAEARSSSEAYLEAAGLFEKAKNYCYTSRASLWALGNSNFCRGLAAGVQYQTSLDLEDHAQAKGYTKNASTNYLQAGFKTASEYAKATQRLFDAYLSMNQAERISDTEKRAKQYQMAENLLQLAAGSFMKAKQPEKTAQVQQILEDVREEKELAISFNEVLQAPTIASSTSTFKAPTSTSEVSAGLESFEHANVQANLVVGLKEVRIGESFCLSVEFVNAGKEPALLTRVEDFVPPGFVVVEKPEIYRLEESCLNMKGKQIAPLKLVEAKVVLQPSKKGVYQLNPEVHYLDDNGQNRSLQLKSMEIKVEEIILADRVPTGTKELDALLLGGIPEEYSVVLTGAPSDERELVIRNFLEAGEGVTSFYVAAEPVDLENLLENSSFYLFLCNPKPKVKVADQPNVYKLHGKADINNLNIAIAQAYRTVKQSSSKRICIEIVSEVLVNYGVKTTRKWISELITDLSSKGFTTLAVMNPGMHPADQATGITDLFDGEISLQQTEDTLESRKALRVKKLRNQDYIKNPIFLPFMGFLADL